jgi:diguanylate cyclase (GGDEF)-like protein
MDSEARHVYERFARETRDAEQRRFWSTMASDEASHVRFWQALEQLSEEDLLPQLIEQPWRTMEELQQLRNKAKTAFERFDADPSMHNMILTAYRLEFALLHPAVAALFHFMQATGTVESPEENYEKHLSAAVEGLNRLGAETPELSLLGELAVRMWNENRRLARQSMQDELTGLFNRRGFFNAIRPLAFLARRNQARVGVFMIDVDDFKTVNERFGHLTGDRVLADVAQSIRRRLRTSDIVGRYGGEEFIAFLPEVNEAAVPRISNDLRERVMNLNTDDIAVTISVGAVSGPLAVDTDKGLQTFIERADACLGQAKRSGKNRVEVYAP